MASSQECYFMEQTQEDASPNSIILTSLSLGSTVTTDHMFPYNLHSSPSYIHTYIQQIHLIILCLLGFVLGEHFYKFLLNEKNCSFQFSFILTIEKPLTFQVMFEQLNYFIVLLMLLFFYYFGWGNLWPSSGVLYIKKEKGLCIYLSSYLDEM